MIQQEETTPQKGAGTPATVTEVEAIVTLQARAESAHVDVVGDQNSFEGCADPIVAVPGVSGRDARIRENFDGFVRAIGGDGPAVRGINTGGSGEGVSGVSANGIGVYGVSANGIGVYGVGDEYTGVSGVSVNGTGVLAQARGDRGKALVVEGPLKVGGNPFLANSPVGTATLNAGMASITIANAVATPHSVVILTPLGNPDGHVWVTRAAESFTIHRNGTLPRVTFAYLIVN